MNTITKKERICCFILLSVWKSFMKKFRYFCNLQWSGLNLKLFESVRKRACGRWFGVTFISELILWYSTRKHNWWMERQRKRAAQKSRCNKSLKFQLVFSILVYIQFHYWSFIIIFRRYNRSCRMSSNEAFTFFWQL